MPYPVNFYQWEGTGQGQYIAPFATLFTGFYFPQDLQQGGNIGFLWHLIEDDSLTLRPITWRIRASGNQSDGNNESTLIDLRISGNFFPLLTESGLFEMAYSGAQSGVAYDNTTLETPFSGTVSGCPLDSGLFECAFTGRNPPVLNEAYTFENRFYGNPTGNLNENYIFEMAFSGNFTRKDKDTASVSVVFTQVSYNVGAATLTMNTGDSGNNISLTFTSITYRPNGG
jgi:hypothetical protein